VQQLRSKASSFTPGNLANFKVGIAVGLFLIALLPRVFGLGIFITSDEPLWMTRSLFFTEAILAGNPADTLQTGHPGVTTMWTGSVGLGLAYLRQMPTATYQEFLASLPHNPDRVDIGLLPWMRLPTVLLAAACVALFFWWGRSLVGPGVALVGALLLAFDPLFLAHSRTLHHDALATIFMSLSVLALLNFSIAGKSAANFYLITSGILAGFALLSKGTSLALAPFAGLYLAWLWVGRKWKFRAIVTAALIWFGAAAGIFVIFWPAMWVIPGQVLNELFGWIIASADVEEVAENTSFSWAGRIPDLGIFFYPVNWLLKSTLLSLIGLLALVGWWRASSNRTQRWVMGWLAIFALLVAVLLTIGDKRDGRYLLPIYPGLWLLTAAGLVWLGQRVIQRIPRTAARIGLMVLFGILLVGFSLPWYPYYHSYYNPTIGGSRLAPRLIKVGWGEGMEQVAAYLNRQEEAETLVVATSYASTFLPFFAGSSVKHHQIASSDYVLNYIRQVQNGYPYPEYWTYYQARPPIFTVQQDAIDYAWLYPGPHISIVRNAEYGTGPTLLGFVLDRNAVQPGQTTMVTLLWRVPPTENAAADSTPIRLRLQDENGLVWAEGGGPVLAPDGLSPVEGNYVLDIPPEIPRGDYELWVSLGNEIHQAGRIPVRQLDQPSVRFPSSVNFGDLITFGGAELGEIDLSTGQPLKITLLWQATKPIPQLYTTIVHVVDDTGQIWGQVDRQPGDGRWPTTGWEKGEWIIDSFELSVKPDTPPGTYSVLVGVYDSQTFERLPVQAGVDNATVIEITSISVSTD